MVIYCSFSSKGGGIIIHIFYTYVDASASGTPASGLPASGTPVSGLLASGTPASGTPVLSLCYPACIPQLVQVRIH